MSRASVQPVRRARLAVGVPFRSQGRDPKTGLDCVGLVAWAFGIPASDFRKDYRLRGNHERELADELRRRFDREPPGQFAPGNILLCRISPNQSHLAIFCGKSIVHADARLRRVVERPGSCPWPIIAVFRSRASTIQSD